MLCYRELGGLVREDEQMLKINLGCGDKKLEGYVNIDKAASVKPDLVFDLDDARVRLPFEDSSVDEIYTEHTLEHIKNFQELIQEMLRVSKIDAIWIIDVPWHSSWGQANDPTHVRCFTHHSFDYYYKAMCWSHEIDNSSGKQLWPLKRYINFSQGTGVLGWTLRALFNPIVNCHNRVQDIYGRFFTYWFPASEINFKLEVVKIK
jgi:SAM-dependent methyltransferase